MGGGGKGMRIVRGADELQVRLTESNYFWVHQSYRTDDQSRTHVIKQTKALFVFPPPTLNPAGCRRGVPT